MSEKNVPLPVNTFSNTDLGEAVNKNIRRCKYVKPIPVQQHTIPISLVGRDLIACAQTGSGKIVAFCFPIISGIMRDKFSRPPHSCMTFPIAFILSQMRELSCRVIKEFHSLKQIKGYEQITLGIHYGFLEKDMCPGFGRS
ncbi:DEAD-box ATP-dependent RNA helicase 37 [Capsicum chinense]|nr:DEAD-box ATP-dependent RNA helicase 37 [Capsicum chinense]